MERASELAYLTDGELKGLLNYKSASLPRQLEDLNELSRRAAERRKAEEVAELVATVPAWPHWMTAPNWYAKPKLGSTAPSWSGPSPWLTVTWCPLPSLGAVSVIWWSALAL